MVMRWGGRVILRLTIPRYYLGGVPEAVTVLPVDLEEDVRDIGTPCAVVVTAVAAALDRLAMICIFFWSAAWRCRMLLTTIDTY